MDQKQRKNARTLLALIGIGAFIAVTIAVAAGILVIRADAVNNMPPVGVPVKVGDQTVIIYPDPAMSVRIVGGQLESSAAGEATATVQPDTGTGTGGEPSTQPSTATSTSSQVATLPPPPPLPTPTPIPPPVILTSYVVMPGDTLYGLTQKFNTSIDLMARYNIAAGNLVAGNTILLPVANPAYCPGSQPHVVRDQQTVSEIARMYGTTPQAIGAANGLDANYSVKTSQVLCVP